MIYRWLPASITCFVVRPLNGKSDQKLIVGKTVQVRSVGGFTGKSCRNPGPQVNSETIPGADLALQGCSCCNLDVVGHPHGAQDGL